MTDFLEQMAVRSRERAALLDDVIDAGHAPLVSLKLDRFDLIAELKDRSPAEGELAVPGNDRATRARAYAAGGAAAISVLTEPSRFDGSMDHLAEVVAAVDGLGVPVMRKDFLVDTKQLLEARAGGASGVLLIAAMLDDAALASMLDCAAELGLFVLLESFDDRDLKRSADLLDVSRHAERAGQGQLLIGVNTRNLRTLEVDTGRLERLASRLPAGALAVAESGLREAADTRRVRALGYSLGLVGTALMRSDDPEALVAGMLSSARDELAA